MYSSGKTFRSKKILIMGLGRLGGGEGVARFFAEEGACVTVTDLKEEKELREPLERLKGLPITYILGKHRKEDFQNQDLVIRNPDVPRESKFLKIAQENKIPIEMDESLFLKLCPVSVIGVTGTRGKTTTTTLIGEILKEAGYRTLSGGNLPGIATISLLRQITPQTKVVLELSSWQLQSLAQSKISPHIALITNIYPDHLNRYKDMDDYIADKKLIFAYQAKKDFLVLNQSDRIVKTFALQAKSKIVWFKRDDWPPNWFLKIPGEHNRENASAALAVGRLLKVQEEVIKKAVGRFSGLPHRLEIVRQLGGVTYINDSSSTTPIAGIVALRAYARKPIVLLAGGNSKKLDLSEFAREIVKRVKAVVLLEGTATNDLKLKIENCKLKINGMEPQIIGRFDNLWKAILAAKSTAETGDVVLLSPGCTSFAMFRNEFDRGEKFKKIVKSLT